MVNKLSVIQMRQQIAERQQQVRFSIGQNLKKYREEKGQTQVELSDLVGIERTSVTNIEAGKNNMTIEQLLYFCEVFEITPNDLLKDV